MSKETSRWKNAERQLANILSEYGIPAERISRAGNYSESTYDVRVLGFPELKCDSKYSIKGFLTSRLLEVVREKYCKNKGDIPIIFCKGYKERRGKIVIDVDFFAELLKCWISQKNFERSVDQNLDQWVKDGEIG